ncbi:MAG: DUF1572 domain-containing protein [Bacteroidia bacterium]
MREVYFGGNWTSSNLRDNLQDVSWQQATTQVYGLNTIATLFFHLHYYVRAVSQVLEGGALDAKDKYSFKHPLIESQQDWEEMQATAWTEAEKFAALIEKLPEERLEQDFSDQKYGHYHRNLQGIIEHTHYHLGQIVLLKKILTQSSS